MFLRLDLGLLSPKVQGKMAAHLPNETNIETDDVAPIRFFSISLYIRVQTVQYKTVFELTWSIVKSSISRTAPEMISGPFIIEPYWLIKHFALREAINIGDPSDA